MSLANKTKKLKDKHEPEFPLRLFPNLFYALNQRNIFKMTERQQEHRMSLEKEAVGSQVKQSKRGQIFGFIIFFVCIAVAIFFAVKLDMKTFASAFLTGTMVVVIGLFITGKNIMRNDLRSKSRDQEK